MESENETLAQIECTFKGAANLAAYKQQLIEIARGASLRMDLPIVDRGLTVTVTYETATEALNFVLGLWKEGLASTLLPPARLPVES